MPMCTLAIEIALARKAMLDEIADLAKDAENEQLTQAALRSIKEIAQQANKSMLGEVDRDVLAVEIVTRLAEKMEADPAVHTENALAVVRLLTEQGWLVVTYGTPA